MWAKLVYQQIWEGTWDSHPCVHDLQHSQLGKTCRRLQIIDTRMGFLCPFCNVLRVDVFFRSPISVSHNLTEILLKGLISWKQQFLCPLFRKSGFCFRHQLVQGIHLKNIWLHKLGTLIHRTSIWILFLCLGRSFWGFYISQTHLVDIQMPH